MKIGLLTSILENYSFEEVVDIAKKKAFNALKSPVGRREWQKGDMQEYLT